MATKPKARGPVKKARSKTLASRNKTPKMPKAPANPSLGAFRPGVGGPWSAKVGQRDVRHITKNGAEKQRTRRDGK